MSVLHIASAVSLRTLRASGPKRASIALAALVSVAVFSTTLATPQPPAAAAAAKTSAPQDQAPLSTDAPEQDPLTVPQGDAKGSPLPTGADRSDESTKSRTLSDAQRNSGRGVLIGRTESADVYRLPNGQTMAEQHAQPINKRDKAGNWSKIDTRLRDVSAEKTGADLGGFSVSLPKTTAVGPIQVTSEGQSLELTAIGLDAHGPSKNAEVKDNKVTYPSAMGGADLAYSVSSTRVTQTVTMQSRPDKPAQFRFNFAAKGLTPRVTDTGVIEFYSQDKAVFAIPQGVAIDAKGNTSPVKVELVGNQIVETPDAKWLASPDRAYPVVVDPDIWYVGREAQGLADAQVIANQPNSNFNGAAQVDASASVNRVGYANGTEYKAAIKFDLSAYANKDVVGAVLETKTYSTGPNGNHAYVMPANAAWDDNTVTWNTFPGYHSGEVEYFEGVANQWSQINVTDWVSNWLEYQDWQNYGFVFDTQGENSYLRMAAEEQAFLNDDPTIRILYHDKASASVTQSPVDNATVATLTPTLTASTSSAPDGGEVRYWFRISDSPDPEIGALISSGWLTSPSWTVPKGALKDGATYSWYVQTGTLSNTTGYAFLRQQNEFSVNALSNKVKFKTNLRLGDQSASPDDTYGPVTVNLTNGNVYTSTSSPTFATVGGGTGLSYSYNSQSPETYGLNSKYWSACLGPLRQPSAQVGSSTISSTIDFSWDNNSPAPSITPDDFCDNHSGVISVPSSGNYCFDLVADDGVKMTIGTAQVVNRWADVATTSPDFGPGHCVNMSGPTGINIDHYDATGGAHLQLWVKTPSGAQFIVPSDWLSPGPRVLPRGWSLSADADADLSYVKATITTAAVVLHDASGTSTEFKRADINNAQSGFVAPADDKSVITAETDGRYRVHGEDGLLYTFGSNGALESVRSALDDRKPAAALYGYVAADGIARLGTITDPVTTRQHTVVYADGSNCPSGTAGFDTQAPTGMLCKVQWWDNTETKFSYNQGRLARILDPGNEVTLFGYDSSGNLTSVRDPQQVDWVAAGSGRDTAGAHTVIKYAANKAEAIVLASPNGQETNTNTLVSQGAVTTRPFHRYEYLSGETKVFTNGINPNAAGYDRKVTYNSLAQTLTETDTARIVVENEWDPSDKLLRTRNQATGQQSTTIYDAEGNVTNAYGPAPYQCFGPDRLPVTASVPGCPDPGVVGHTSTAYDEGINSLAVAWWDNENLAGAPKKHSTTIRNDGGPEINMAWGTGAANALGQSDNFSLRAIGKINLPTAGINELSLEVDDGARLWIDDTLVIDHWTGGVGVFSGAFNNTAPGWHRIRIDYRELTGSAILVLRNKAPGAATPTVVSGSDLKPNYNLATTSTTHDSSAAVGNRVVKTSYNDNGWDPAYGLETSSTEDPSGLALSTSHAYETPSDTTYLRELTRTLPAGNAYTSAYYGEGEQPDAYCSPAPTAPQTGYLKTKTYPLAAGQSTPRVDHFAYDERGRVICSRTNNEPSAATTYDARGRITSEFKPEPAPGNPWAGRVVTYNYAVGGDPLSTSVSDSKGAITTVTDLLGRVLNYTDVFGRTTAYSYDTAGRQTTLTSWGDYRQTEYDSFGRVSVQKAGWDAASLKPVAIPSYDAAGRVTSVNYPDGAANGNANGTTATFGYDAANRNNSISYARGSTILASDAVTRSQSGIIVDQSVDGSDARPSGPNFIYDPTGRLTQAWAKAPDGTTHAYTYSFATPTSCGSVSGASGNAYKNTNRTSWTDNGTTIATNCYDAADRLISTTDSRYSNPQYDDHGNTVAMGNQQMTYDLDDRHLSTTANGTTVTYTRDATDRIITRTEGSSTLRYSYSSAGDSPDMVMDLNNTVVDKMVDLVGGVVKNTHLENNTYSDKYSHPNIHGDVIVLTDSSGTKQGTTKTYDPFGEALGDIPDNLSGNADLGWLGGKDRLTEHFGSVRTIQMGQRQYVPGLGRFLEVDPVEGGSANDYDYCDADPIGCVDLDGTIGFKKFFRDHWKEVAVAVAVVAIVAVGCATGIGCGAAVAAGARITVSVGTKVATRVAAARAVAHDARDAYRLVSYARTGASAKRFGSSERAIRWAGRAWTAGGRTIHRTYGGSKRSVGRISRNGDRVYRWPSSKKYTSLRVANLTLRRAGSNVHIGVR